eukprot:6485162-Amphidinium_carterae.2
MDCGTTMVAELDRWCPDLECLGVDTETCQSGHGGLKTVEVAQTSVQGGALQLEKMLALLMS